MSEQADDSEYFDPYCNDLAMAGITIAECATAEGAWFLVHLLKEQGIRAAVSVPATRMDLRAPQVRVAPDDEEKARSVLSKPVSVEDREAYDSEPEVEPEPLPVCPKCGAPDLILEGVDEVNHWHCEACGIKWDEDLRDL